MEDSGAALEVGFAIDAGGSFETLAQLASVMQSTEAKILTEAKNIERATSGMVDLGAATASILAFGNAASREAQTAARELGKVEKAGESLSRQLDRQAATFGKTSSEIRTMKVETAALAAEQKGLTELAERLRAQEADLYAREFAAARQVRLEAESAAEEKRHAASVSAAAVAAETTAVQDAAQAYQLFNAVAKQAMGAYRAEEAEKAAAEAEIEAKAVRDAAEAYRLFNAVAKQRMAAYRDDEAANLTRETAAAKQAATEHERLAAMVRGSHDAQEADALAAERLREATDPLYASTKRLNAAIEESTRLYHSGATAPAEYARQQEVLNGRLAAATVQHNEMAVAGGRNAFALSQVALQLPDIFEGLATGQKPMTVFIQQGSQIAQIAMLAEGGIKGLAKQIALLALPFTPVIIAAGALFAAFKLFQSEVQKDGDLTRYRDGLGLTHKEMLELSDGTDKAGDKIARLTGVTVTAGDVMAGVWKAIREGAGDSSGWDGFKDGAVSAFKAVLGTWEVVAASITAGINGTFTVVKTVWGSFPAVFGDLFVQGVNAAIGALNRLVKTGVDQINAVIATANKLPGISLGTIAAPQIDPIDNAYAGAAAKAAKAIGSSYSDAYAAARKADSAFWKQAGDNAKQHARDRLAEEAKAIKDDRTPKKPKVDRNALNAEATEAQIRNLYALADAYRVSDAAALIAEAREKAESKAIKQRADVEAAVAREVRLVVAQRIADVAKTTAAMVEQTAAQKLVNDQVAAGILPAARAADALRDMTALRPIEAAMAAAQQVKDTKGADAARDAITRMTAAQAASNAERERASLITDTASSSEALERIRLEASLIGATNTQRAVALAQLEAEQHVRDLGQTGSDAGNNYVQARVAEARATAGLQVANDNYNVSLTRQSALLDAINEQAQAAGQGLSDAFGKAGDAIGSAVSALTEYGASQARIAEEKAAQVKAAGGDAKRLADIEKLYAVKSATAQANAIGTVIGAGKSLFKAHSAGYKVMDGAEKAYRAVQLALAIKTAAEQIALMVGLTATKVATDTTMTASDTARAGVEQSNSVATTAVKAVEAVVNAIKSLPFPLNLAAGAATIAALATLGVAVGGGFGGGGKNTLAKANDGTGTVLGDATAKSESLSKSIDALKSVDTLTMSYSRDMLSALKSIDSQLGSLTTTLINAGNIGSTVGVSEKSASVFGTSTKIMGSGIVGGASSLGDIAASGSYGTDYYADVQKKKKFLGITTSTKYKTQYASDGSDIDQQFGLILKGFYSAIDAAAGPLGLATSAVESKLDSFVVDIGKIDLKGLSGTEIQEKLSAVFSAEGDKIAEAAIPGLEKYQVAGEGYLETLTRVASTVETVTGTLTKLGESTTNLGIDASMAIAKQFDSLSDFTDAASSYFESYYSQAEQASARSAQLAKVFASLNLAMPDTLAGFRALVEAQDLTTSAGQSTYATLLQLAPAFADLKTSLEGVKSAADIASERADLQQQILEAQGDTAALRAAELAKVDASNRDLQMQLYAIQDAKTAADAAATLAQAWASVGDTIKTEIDRIRGLTDTGTGGSFADLLGQFNAANAAARGGDQDAAKSLPALSQSLLTAAAAAATSRQELDRVQAQTAAQLEATYAAISGLTGTSSTISDATTSTIAATQASTSTTAANDDLASEIAALRDEVAQLRKDNNAGHAATAGQVTATNRRLDDVTAASGGEAVSVAGIAA